MFTFANKIGRILDRTRQRLFVSYFALTMAGKGSESSSTKLAPEKKAPTKLDTQFRRWVTADGSSGLMAEKGRYHLYVSLACPFAHRAVILRKMKGLDDVISMTVLDWSKREEHGFSFSEEKRLCSADPLFGAKYLSEIYFKAMPDYEGRYSVPVLWDKKTSTIVNNESSEILRMFNKEFNDLCPSDAQKAIDLYPEGLRDQIEDVHKLVYPNINIGVYQCGFARDQATYDKSIVQISDALDQVEEILSKSRYLTGNTLTEADVRLFTTLVRFDLVYVVLFKCNKKRIVDYPNIWGFTRDLYQTPGIGETVDIEHITKHYYTSLTFINPFGIVPIGPDLDFSEPHDRDNM